MTRVKVIQEGKTVGEATIRQAEYQTGVILQPVKYTRTK